MSIQMDEDILYVLFDVQEALNRGSDVEVTE